MLLPKINKKFVSNIETEPSNSCNNTNLIRNNNDNNITKGKLIQF